MDGTFQQNHLLTLLFVINLLTLGHFVVIGHFKLELAKGALSFFDLCLFVFVLSTVHHFFCSQLIDLLLTQLSLDFPFFPGLVSKGVVHLGCTWLSSSDIRLRFFFGSFITFCSFFQVVYYVVLVHLVFFFCSDFTLENLFELINVVSKEFRHLWDAECGDEGTRAHGFHRPFLEVENVVELLFNFIQFDCIFLDFPLFFLLCLLNLVFRPLDKFVEVFRVNIEVLFLDLDHIFHFFVLLDDFGEAISQLFNFRPDLSLLFFGDLKLPVLFSSELCLSNGIHALIFYVATGWDLERWRQVCSVKSINVWVDFWEIRGVVLLES